MLYIIYIRDQFHDYILDGVKNNKKICLIPAGRREISILLRIIRKILSIFNLSNHFPFLYFKRSFVKKIKLISGDDKIFIQGITDLNELRILAKMFPNKNDIHFWCWNPLSKEYKGRNSLEINEIIKQQKSLGYKIETFDNDDSDFYKIVLRNQFYRLPPEVNNEMEIAYDFYFIGYLKDRENEIYQLMDQLKDLGYRIEFKVIKDKIEELSYLENIENIFKSKCIVDINQKGQSGITIRPLEAIFFNKKLITNNTNIIKEDIYHPNNVFIIGVDNINLLSHFMSTGTVKLPNKILDKYEINNWMEYYL